MTTGMQEITPADEDKLLAEAYPQVAEHLAARYAKEYDVDTGLARFGGWLDEHTDGGDGTPASPDPIVHVHGDVNIHTGEETETAASAGAVLGLLIEREQAARRDSIRAGQRVLAAMIGFAVITSVSLAFTPHFGVPLVVATSILAGLVAAVAIRTQPPPGRGGSGYPDPLLDLARSTMPGQTASQSQHIAGNRDKPAEPGTGDPKDADTGTAASVGSRPLSMQEMAGGITATGAAQWELETGQKPLFARHPETAGG